MLMNLFEVIILNVLLIVFPILCYIVYLFFSKTFNQRRNELVLDVALISSVYLSLKYGYMFYKSIPLILFDIPFIIACLKKRYFSVITILILILYYYTNEFNMNVLILIFSYLIYILNFIKWKKIDFMSISLVIKCLIFYSPYINKSNIGFLSVIIIVFYIITKFLISLFKNAESIFSLYRSLQNFEDDKESKESLFKITHEIKNPIAVVKGYLDMFDTNNSEHSTKYIPIIKEEISRVLMLLEDFLSITKIKIEKEEMDLGFLLEDIKNNFSLILKNRNIELICKEIEELYIEADYNRLKQVLVNLIKNSVESIEKNGTIKINISKSKSKIKIIIEDNGKGMTEEELKQITTAFFTTKQKGTGLGTYLSSEIIKAHNGFIKYHSKKNKGTKVVITIPK